MITLFRRAVIISTLLLVPALVLAQDTASTTRNKPPLGPAIKNTIQDAREGIKATASSTRDAVKTRVEQVKALIDERKDAMRLRLEDNRHKITERAETAKTQARTRFGEAAETSVGNIISRLGNNADHLADISERLGMRITELEAQGKSMAASLALLAQAEAAIAAAHDKVAAVGTALAAALASENPKQEMPKVREAVAAAQTALKTAKDALQKTIETVRLEAAASTTPAV